MPRGWVSYMRTATTSPEAAVRAATAQMAVADAEGVGERRRRGGRRRRSRRRATAGRRRRRGRARRGGRRRRWRRAGSGRPWRCRRRAGPRPSAHSAKLCGGGDQADGDGLEQHAAGDQRLAADPVGQRAGDELAEPPHGGVERGEHADLADGQAGGGEQEREQAPGQAVVEVVDQPGLAGRGQGRLAEAGQGEHLPVGERGVQVVVAAVGAVAWVAASSRAWPRVSRTTRVDRPRPSAA